MRRFHSMSSEKKNTHTPYINIQPNICNLWNILTFGSVSKACEHSMLNGMHLLANVRKITQTNKQARKKTRFIASPLNSHFTRILCVLHRQYANEPVALLWTISFNRTKFFFSRVNTSTHTNIMAKRKWYLESK